MSTVHRITFSPTGGTRKVGVLLCQGLGENITKTELYIPEEQLSLPTIAASDVVIELPHRTGHQEALRIKKSQRVVCITPTHPRAIQLQATCIHPARGGRS